MGRVHRLSTSVSDVRLADAVRIYLATITVPNTRATYAAALDRLVADLGADTECGVAGLGAGSGQWLVHLRVGWQVGEDVQHSVDRAGVGAHLLARAAVVGRRSVGPAAGEVRAAGYQQGAEQGSGHQDPGIGCGTAGTGAMAHALRILDACRGGVDVGCARPRHREPVRGGDPQGRARDLIAW